MLVTDYFDPKGTSPVERGEMGDVFLWALGKMRDEKNGSPAARMSQKEHQELCRMPDGLIGYLEAAKLYTAPLSAGRLLVLDGSVLLGQERRMAILDISWYYTTARYLNSEWPMWATLSDSSNVYDKMLAAIGKHLLVGGR